MNQLPINKRVQIINLLVEGNSLRSTSRLTGTSINTVMKLLVDVGYACLKFHSQTVVQVRAKRIQCDEIWSFCYSKQKNTSPDVTDKGDVWTWVGFDPDTKMVISWFAGQRDLRSAKFFINDLWCRLRTRVQLSTDGLSSYVEAIADTFGGKIDFGQVVKQYSNESMNIDGTRDRRMKYIGAERKIISGNPDPKYISTSLLERQNLTMRMCMRRFTRKTNAFSKKLDNHCCAIALHFVFYNFCRIHKALRVTPAMEAGFAKKPMKIEEILDLINIYSN